MFIVSKIKDTISVDAEDMEDDRGAVLKRVLNKKYANKILPNIGLGIAVFDILDASEGMVLHADGCTYHKVVFRLVVFKPFLSETFEARVCACSARGLVVTTRFFDEIKIPAYKLAESTCFDQRKERWFWAANYEPEEPAEGTTPEAFRAQMKADLQATPEDERFYIELGEMVRVRLDEEVFMEAGPQKAPKMVLPGVGQEQQNEQKEPEVQPWTLVCSMEEAGLGVLDWWRSGGEDTEMQDGEEEAQTAES